MSKNVGKNRGVLALAIARGLSQRAAAEKAKCSAKTVERAMADPTFRSRVDELRSAMVSRALGRFSASLAEAAMTMRRLLKAENAFVRLGAASKLIELTTKVRESAEFERRLAELERRQPAAAKPKVYRGAV